MLRRCTVRSTCLSSINGPLFVHFGWLRARRGWRACDRPMFSRKYAKRLLSVRAFGRRSRDSGFCPSFDLVSTRFYAAPASSPPSLPPSLPLSRLLDIEPKALRFYDGCTLDLVSAISVYVPDKFRRLWTSVPFADTEVFVGRCDSEGIGWRGCFGRWMGRFMALEVQVGSVSWTEELTMRCSIPSLTVDD